MKIENLTEYLKYLIKNHEGKLPISIKSLHKIKKPVKKKYFQFESNDLIDHIDRIDRLLDIIIAKLDIQM